MISTTTSMTNTNMSKSADKTVGRADRLAQQLQSAQRRERELQRQRRVLVREQAQLDRKKRNRRIFTRGGMLEAFMREPLLLTDDQVYRLLQTAFNTREVRDAEDEMIAEAARALERETEGQRAEADDGSRGGWGPGDRDKPQNGSPDA